MSSEQLRGYLVIKVLEAAGQNAEDERVWDSDLKECFVKSKRMMGISFRMFYDMR